MQRKYGEETERLQEEEKKLKYGTRSRERKGRDSMKDK